MPGSDIEIRVRVRDYASPALRRVDDAARTMAGQAAGAARGLAMIGGGAGAITVLLSVAAAATQAAGALLIIPGAVVAGGAILGTMQLALGGVSEALAAASSGTAAYEAALAKLSPAARDLVVTLKELTPQWEALQRSVQDRFFQNMATDMSLLAGTYIPLLDTGLGGIAGSLNGMIGYGFDSIMKPDVIADVNSILGNTSLFLDNASTALGDFLAGFIGLAEVGAGFLPQFGTWIADIASLFLAWVENGDGANGTIQTLIENGIAGFAMFWQVLTDVWAVIVAIIGGLAGEDDAGFLGGMTASVREFAESEATQTLLGFIGNLARFITELAPYWIPLALGIYGASAAMSLFNMIMAANPIVLVVLAIAGLVAAFMWAWNNVAGFSEFWAGIWPWLSSVFQGFAGMIADGVNWISGVIAGFQGWLGGIDLWGGLAAPFQGFIGMVSDGWNWLMDRVRGVQGWLGNLDLWGGLMRGLRGQVNGAIGTLNGLITGVNRLIFGFNTVSPWDMGYVPYIPYLAKGGIAGGMAVVGEAGPELVKLPQGSTVYPTGQSQRMAEQLGGGGASGGVVRVELVAGAGADNAVASMLMGLVRTGQLQLQVAS